MSYPAQHVADGAKRQNMNQTTTVSLSLLGSPSLDQRKNHQLPTDDLDDEQLRLAERAWDYERGRRLGSGSFGTVYQCRNRKTGKLMAVKVLQEHTGRKYEREKWKREVTNMNKATHVRLKFLFPVIISELTWIADKCSEVSRFKRMERFASGNFPRASNGEFTLFDHRRL